MDQSIIDYLARNQGSRQWRGFLAALAEEFAAQLNEADLRALMRRIGTRFATAYTLSGSQTLEAAQLTMNTYWDAQDWGWVQLEERADHLLIRHYCSPLASTFGAAHLRWTPAFLEGTYQHWFRSLGSGSTLTVQQSSQADPFGCVELRLGQ